MARPSSRTAFLLLLVFFLALASLGCFAIPFYVIWPFRHQGASELAVALFIKQIGPWLSVARVAACVIVAVSLWPRARWMARSAAMLAIVLGILGVFLSRFNMYEQMFHPLEVPQFESAQTAKIDPDDMVIAVDVKGVRRAYPIREMAYHHVVNDTLGSQPIVATY